ncbi:MAG: thiamine-monophosphate kinase [Arenicella sp.]
MERTEIEDLGEFGLIDRLKKSVKSYNKTTQKGIGDDAAVVSNEEETTVVSTDMLLEGVHFDLSYMPLKHLGYKAMAVNFSDIAAMNALPTQVLVSIGLSNRFSVEAIDAIYEGINMACEKYKVDLIGGDTTTSRSGLVISVTVFGQAKKANLAYRNGAKKNDVICVTGDLGGAYLGLQVLEREKQVYLANKNMQPKLEEYNYIVERQLKPEARTEIVHEFLEQGIVPTSMIDISDGLASELFHICTQSGLGCVIYEEKLPVEAEVAEVAAKEFQIPIATVAMNGGEDYELLFTIDQEDFKKIENHQDITPIGYTTEASKGLTLITRAKQMIPIQAQGWKHFQKSE